MIQRTELRATAVLARLRAGGPAVITDLALDMGIDGHLVRYALRMLSDRAFIKEYIKVMGRDGVPRYVAVFAAGSDINAKHPHQDQSRLDFRSTLHLQDVYTRWAQL